MSRDCLFQCYQDPNNPNAPLEWIEFEGCSQGKLCEAEPAANPREVNEIRRMGCIGGGFPTPIDAGLPSICQLPIPNDVPKSERVALLYRPNGQNQVRVYYRKGIAFQNTQFENTTIQNVEAKVIEICGQLGNEQLVLVTSECLSKPTLNQRVAAAVKATIATVSIPIA